MSETVASGIREAASSYAAVKSSCASWICGFTTSNLVEPGATVISTSSALFTGVGSDPKSLPAVPSAVVGPELVIPAPARTAKVEAVAKSTRNGAAFAGTETANIVAATVATTTAAFTKREWTVGVNGMAIMYPMFYAPIIVAISLTLYPVPAVFYHEHNSRRIEVRIHAVGGCSLPTTTNAHTQAIGVVNDHVNGCAFGE